MPQKHFSLMGEMLSTDLPKAEQIEALLEHAEKELAQAVKLSAKEVFGLVKGDLGRAHALNDATTAMHTAFSRLQFVWHLEDTGQKPRPETQQAVDMIRTAMVPDLNRITRED